MIEKSRITGKRDTNRARRASRIEPLPRASFHHALNRAANGRRDHETRTAADAYGSAGVRIGGREVALTGRAVTALLLLAVLVTLAVFFPRIPNRYGGGLWRYFAGYTAVLVLLTDVWRPARSIRAWWTASERRRRTGVAALGILTALAGTLALREWAPEAFGVLSRESGLWEPLSLLAYWGGAILIYRNIPEKGRATDRRPWLAAAGAYALLGLEEIDYFGIFGAMIGRIDGVYAGSLHDMIRLATEGVVSAVGWSLIVALLTGVLFVLWRTGWIAPSFLGRMVRGREVGWLAAGFAFLWIAAAEEAHFFGWIAPHPTPEEAVELVGALFLGLYALEVTARRLGADHAAPVIVRPRVRLWRQTPARGDWGQAAIATIRRTRAPATRQGSTGVSEPV